jgi:hypothetical protein
MQLYGVIPEQPRINLDPPILHYLVISVNGQIPVAVADGQTLMIAPGTTVEVVHIGANYDRGLSVDVLGAGSLNDIRMPLVIDKPTKVIARRDNQTFGQISLKLFPPDSTETSPQLLLASQVSVVEAGAGWLPGMTLPSPVPEIVDNQSLKTEDQSKDEPAIASAGNLSTRGNDQTSQNIKVNLPETPVSAENGVTGFVLEVDGQRLVLRPKQTLTVRQGAKVTLVDLESSEPLPTGTVMNLRGFIGRNGDTTGNDQGTTANTATDMIARFAMELNGQRVYQLGAEHGPKLLTAAYLNITQPKLKSVTLEVNGQEKVLTLGQRWGLKPGTPVKVKEVLLDNQLELTNPRYTLGGRSFPHQLPQTITMPSIAVSLAVFTDDDLAGKVVLFPTNN